MTSGVHLSLPQRRHKYYFIKHTSTGIAINKRIRAFLCLRHRDSDRPPPEVEERVKRVPLRHQPHRERIVKRPTAKTKRKTDPRRKRHARIRCVIRVRTTGMISCQRQWFLLMPNQEQTPHRQRPRHHGMYAVPKTRYKMYKWKRYAVRQSNNNNNSNCNTPPSNRPLLPLPPATTKFHPQQHRCCCQKCSYQIRNSNLSNGNVSKRPIEWWDSGYCTHSSIKRRCNNKYNPIVGYQKLPLLDDQMWE